MSLTYSVKQSLLDFQVGLCGMCIFLKKAPHFSDAFSTGKNIPVFPKLSSMFNILVKYVNKYCNNILSESLTK